MLWFIFNKIKFFSLFVLINVVSVVVFIINIIVVFILVIIIGIVIGSLILVKCLNGFIFIFLVVLMSDGLIFLILVYVFFKIGNNVYIIRVIIVGIWLILNKGIIKFNNVNDGMVWRIVVIFIMILDIVLVFVNKIFNGIVIVVVINNVINDIWICFIIVENSCFLCLFNMLKKLVMLSYFFFLG